MNVIVKLQGGLGNQMFQYAMGRCLSCTKALDLKLDISFFEDHPERKYELNNFDIVQRIANTEESDKLKNSDSKRLNRIKQRYLGSPQVFVQESSLMFDPQYLAIMHSAYLDGYWQSEKYFRQIENVIRQELKVSTPPSAANRALLDEIESVNAVSLHVRRGDYEEDPVINQVHGTCSLNYYEEAASLIVEKVSQPVFYVFSDDIPWAKDNLNLGHNFQFVSINNGENAHEDLRLMYSCKHHIIANSTLSWWGAWLNPNPDKIVVAPQKWFNDPELNLQSKTIVPESWIRL